MFETGVCVPDNKNCFFSSHHHILENNLCSLLMSSSQHRPILQLTTFWEVAFPVKDVSVKKTWAIKTVSLCSLTFNRATNCQACVIHRRHPPKKRCSALYSTYCQCIIQQFTVSGFSPNGTERSMAHGAPLASKPRSDCVSAEIYSISSISPLSTPGPTEGPFSFTHMQTNKITQCVENAPKSHGNVKALCHYVCEILFCSFGVVAALNFSELVFFLGGGARMDNKIFLALSLLPHHICKCEQAVFTNILPLYASTKYFVNVFTEVFEICGNRSCVLVLLFNSVS